MDNSHLPKRTRPYTPDQVAILWGCSPNHVRNLIKQGQLRAFRLGERLLRIPAEAITEFEQRQMLEASEFQPAPLPVSPQQAIVITHSRERKR